MNKPFLKWAGSKTRALNHILPIIGTPKLFIEPFAGSMSVALNVAAQQYVLNDANPHLAALYNAVISDDSFVDKCSELFTDDANDCDVYNARRAAFNANPTPELFVYLNRHCFNGLTRYNKKGYFNVAFGRYEKPYFPYDELTNFRKIFSDRKFQIYNLDFADQRLFQTVNKDTVVYCDPPYVPLSVTSNFTDYTSVGFSMADQERLRDLAINLANKGATVIISNHDTKIARNLYADAKQIVSFPVRRSISAGARNPASEILAVYRNSGLPKYITEWMHNRKPHVHQIKAATLLSFC